MSLPFYPSLPGRPALYLLVPVYQPFPFLDLLAEPAEPFVLPDRRSPALRAWREANKKAAPAPAAPEPKASMKAGIRVRSGDVKAEVAVDGSEGLIRDVLLSLGVIAFGGAIGAGIGWAMNQTEQQSAPQPVAPVQRKKKRRQVAA